MVRQLFSEWSQIIRAKITPTTQTRTLLRLVIDRRGLLDITGETKSVWLYWVHIALTIVPINTVGRLLIPVGIAVAVGHTILTAAAIINPYQSQLYFVLSVKLLAASSAGFAILRFCEVIYAETQQLQGHQALMRGRNKFYKSRVLQPIVGNKACGMHLAVRRGVIWIIQSGVVIQFLQVMVENAVLVKVERSFCLLSKG